MVPVTTIPDDLATLRVIHYPDPRLRVVSVPVPTVDDAIRRLVPRMFELMFASKGIGLAAPQVGINLRLFVASPEFDEKDKRVYINPRIVQADQWQEEEEGCLSLPQMRCKIKRYNLATIEATDLEGKLFQEVGKDLAARAFQHEIDHLDGKMLLDKMSAIAKLANRRLIKDLEEQFEKGQ